MIKYPIHKRPNNVIYSADDESRYYLEIHTNVQNAKWDGKSPAFLFDGNYCPNDQTHKVFYGLLDYIKNEGIFNYSGDRRNAPTHRIDDEPDVSLLKLLHSLYTGITLDELQDANVSLVDNSKVVLDSLTDPEEIEFLRTHHVYNATIGNIVSNIHGAESHSTSHIIVEYSAIVVEYAGKRFYTDYNQGLLSLLRSIPNWNIVGGSLKTNIAKERTSPDEKASKYSLFVPFSTIVVAYHQGLVPDTEDIRDRLRGIYDSTAGKKIVIDHVTERPENNFLPFLVPSYQTVNGVFSNYRTRFKKPFFYFSMYDHSNKMCLVWCGDERAGWEKYIAFNDLTIEENYRGYATFFKFFRDEIVKPAGCIMDEPGDNSTAYYWSDPGRLADKVNPYNKLLSATMDRFDRYHDGIFVDVLGSDGLAAALNRMAKKKKE